MPGMISNASSAVGTVSLMNGATQLAGKTILFNSAGATNQESLIRNVSAGKTYYLVSLVLYYTSTTDGLQCSVYVEGAGQKILRLTSVVEATYRPKDFQKIVLQPPNPIPILDGNSLLLFSQGAGLTAECCCLGFEE